MAGIFFTADTHFGHGNIIKYCQRPFGSVREMDGVIAENWNRIVNPTDLIFNLGDFSWLGAKQMQALLERLNGRKFLCIGSHDKRVSRLVGFFECIRESFLVEVGERQFVFFNHYLHKVWPKSHHGSLHLFGHSHGRMNAYAEQEGKLLDVGVDSHNFYPWSLDEVAAVMAIRPLNFNDLRKRPR